MWLRLTLLGQTHRAALDQLSQTAQDHLLVTGNPLTNQTIGTTIRAETIHLLPTVVRHLHITQKTRPPEVEVQTQHLHLAASLPTVHLQRAAKHKPAASYQQVGIIPGLEAARKVEVGTPVVDQHIPLNLRKATHPNTRLSSDIPQRVPHPGKMK